MPSISGTLDNTGVQDMRRLFIFYFIDMGLFCLRKRFCSACNRHVSVLL